MENQIAQFQQLITVYGLNILAALFIFFIGKWAAVHFSNWTEKILLKARFDETLAKFSKNLTYMGLLAFVVLAALARLGIQTASFIAVLGAAGFAVGMALQGSLGNFAAGVLILIFRPFKLGDTITVNGVTGDVQEIQIFETILNTADNMRIIVPNSQCTGCIITNVNANPTRRIDLVVGVSYGDDLLKAKKILQDLLDAQPGVLKNPAPVVAVSELAESSVNFVVRPWVKTSDYWDVRFALVERIKLELDQNGITIPFPQRDIHLLQQPANAR